MVFLYDLIVGYLHVAHGGTAVVAIDAPAVSRQIADAYTVCQHIVDIDHGHRIVCIDGHVISIVFGRMEEVAVLSVQEAASLFALFLKIEFLLRSFPFGIHDERIILLAVRATHKRKTETGVGIVGSDAERNLVVYSQYG